MSEKKSEDKKIHTDNKNPVLEDNKANTENKKPKKTFMEKLKYAFSVDGGNDFTKEEDEVLDRVASWLHKKNLVTPSILFIETLSPLNFLGSQMMTFLKPVLGNVLSEKDYTLLESALAKRNCIHLLVDKIVEKDQAVEMKRKKQLDEKK